MADVFIRNADPRDAKKLAVRFCYDETLDRETVALFRGNTLRAHMFLMERAFDRNIGRTMVAEADGEVVGLLEYELPGDLHPSRLVTLSRMVAVARARLSYRTLVARMLVNTPFPDNAFIVSNVRVLDGWRGHGIGSCLLHSAEAEAHFCECPLMALSVLSDNPAVRLYKRMGYSTHDVKQHPWYLNGTSRCMFTKGIAQ